MAILFQDDFARANNGPGSNWTIDTDGVYNLVSQVLRGTGSLGGGSAQPSAWVNAIATRVDMNVEAKLRVQNGAGGGNACLVARRTAGTTFYRCRFNGIGGGTTLILERNVSGTLFTIGSVGIADGGNFHTFRLEVFGTAPASLKAYRDGVLLLDFTDSAITAAGRGGVTLTSAEGFADDFFIMDSPGPAPINIDSIIPIDYRTLIQLDSIIPVYNTFANLLNINPSIPVSYRVLTLFDSIIPILYKFPEPLKLDHIIPILWRRLLEIDREIPVQYSQLDPWIKQIVSEIETWLAQAASEADVWTKQGASEASTWSPV